jgi:hypothetical protein
LLEGPAGARRARIISSGQVVELIVEATDLAPLGHPGRLDLHVRSRDCKGRAAALFVSAPGLDLIRRFAVKMEQVT